MVRASALAACALAVGVLGACGGDDSPSRERTPNPQSTPASERDGTTDQIARGSRDPKRFRTEAADSFAEAGRGAPREGSRLDQALGELPVRLPPLPVQQYVVTDGSHRIVARLDSRDYYCIGDPSARRAAIEAYVSEAEATFAGHDIDDLALTVALNSDDINDFKVLARADHTSGVKLTTLGRADRCR